MVDRCGLTTPRADWSDQMIYLSPKAGEDLSIGKKKKGVENDDEIVPQPSSGRLSLLIPVRRPCFLSHLGEEARDSQII